MYNILINTVDTWMHICEMAKSAWMCFVDYLNTFTIANKTYGFLKPFFISVVAFSIPFLYKACLDLDKRYNSTLVSVHLRRTKSYILFWIALAASLIVICADMIFRASIVSYKYGYFILSLAHCVAILFLLFEIVALFKVILNTADMNYVGNLIKNNISRTKDFNKEYNNQLKRITKKYRYIKILLSLEYQIVNRLAKGCSKIKNVFSNITNKLRKRSKLLFLSQKKIETSLLNREELERQTLDQTIDKKYNGYLKKLSEILSYAIKNQDSLIFASTTFGYEIILEVYRERTKRNTKLSTPLVVYPNWLYKEIYDILRRELCGSSSLGFDIQMEKLLEMFFDTERGTLPSLQTLRLCDEIVLLSATNQRNSFITQFFKFAEQYFLEVLQREEVADWNKKEGEKIVPFINNLPLVFALFIFVLRAQLFSQHSYIALSDTENHVGIPTTYGSKHLYKLEVTDIIQLYLIARYAFSGYAFMFYILYPSLITDTSTLLRQIDEYTAFLLLKKGKQAIPQATQAITKDIPNEMIGNYFGNLGDIVNVLKRDRRLMGMFRLDDSLMAEDFDSLKQSIEENKWNHIAQQEKSPQKVERFKKESNTYISWYFDNIRQLFNRKNQNAENWDYILFESVSTEIDKRAFIDNSDIDASSLLGAPAQMYSIKLKDKLYKNLFESALTNGVYSIDSMNILEKYIEKLVGNRATDYIFIDCMLPYYVAKKDSRLQKNENSYSFDGEPFLQEDNMYGIDNTFQSLIIINKNDVFALIENNLNEKELIGDELFMTTYSIEETEDDNRRPLCTVSLSLGVKIKYNPNAEVYIIRVNQKW